MQSSIFIRLLPKQHAIEWVQLDEKAKVLHGPVTGEETVLAERARQADVVVVVPGVDVVLTQVNVPKMSSARLQQAVPNLLEDQLAENTERLHFAFGTPVADQPLSVAVVNKTKMNDWIAFLNEKIPGIQSSVMAFVPDILCLPWQEQQWSMLPSNGEMLVRTGYGQGFSADKSNLALLVKGLSQSAEQKPELIQIYGEGFQDELHDLSLTLNQQPAPPSLIAFFAQHLKDAIPFNLLQHEYERDHKYQVTRKLLTSTALLVVVWVSILTVIDASKYLYLSRQSDGLKQQITTVYKSIFPDATSMVSPRRRIERLLSSLNAGKQTNEFVMLLSKVSPVVEKGKGIELKELDYTKKQLQLKVEASDFALLDKFVADLKSSGVNVEQSGASKTGSTIQSMVVVRS